MRSPASIAARTVVIFASPDSGPGIWPFCSALSVR